MRKLIALLMLSFSCISHAGEPPKQPLIYQDKGGHGRYVFGQISDMRADQYLLDTETGRIWLLEESTDKTIKSGRVLVPVEFTSDAGFSTLPK